MRIVIVDYGSGNLHSVKRAAAHATEGLDAEVIISTDPDAVRAADRVIFPGQGAMPDCMKNLSGSGLEEAVREALRTKPVLAICIGMQMLFEHSEEGDVRGLGLYPGAVRLFPRDMREEGVRLKVPQIGWNRVHQTQKHPLWQGIPDDSWYYFVHSYYLDTPEKSLRAGSTHYGFDFTSAVAKDNIFATQFHPEKSARCGLALFRNFVTWMP